MRRRPVRPSTRRVTLRRRVGDADEQPIGLVVGLHGYGADERQLDTLLPLDLPVVIVQPRAARPVDPRFGWWSPERSADGAIELAPRDGVDAAVESVVEMVRAAQTSEGFGRDRTVLVGYSQGAALALSAAARRPDLFAAVVTGAGSLLPGERVSRGVRPLDLLVMNGTLDPVVSESDHADTVERFERAGHVVTARRDPIPHVIDRAQWPFVDAFVAAVLARGDEDQCEPGVPMSISAPRRRWVARPPTSRSNTTR